MEVPYHLYLGAEVMSSNGVRGYKLSSVSIGGNLNFTAAGFDVNIGSGYKLLLRRLESMTEEEARHFCKMEGWGENLENIVVTDSAIEFNQGQMQAISRFTRCRPEMFSWLLSKSFDLFGLIDKKLALDINEVK